MVRSMMIIMLTQGKHSSSSCVTAVVEPAPPPRNRVLPLYYSTPPYLEGQTTVSPSLICSFWSPRLETRGECTTCHANMCTRSALVVRAFCYSVCCLLLCVHVYSIIFLANAKTSYRQSINLHGCRGVRVTDDDDVSKHFIYFSPKYEKRPPRMTSLVFRDGYQGYSESFFEEKNAAQKTAGTYVSYIYICMYSFLWLYPGGGRVVITIIRKKK